MRLLPYMLRSGDVLVRGSSRREVKGVRRNPRSSGRDDFLVMFKSGPPLEVRSGKTLKVERVWPPDRREAQR